MFGLKILFKPLFFNPIVICLFVFKNLVFSQSVDFTATRVTVDFSVHLQEWDGFGFNYVETAQTMNYTTDPQDYGGFSLLSDEQKAEITELVFGETGLKAGLVKMFLDPWHQESPGAAFDHKSTTSNMREFVKMGLSKTRENGRDLRIITTLYGPPPWATSQKFLRGRDLDPEMKEPLALYMIDWVRFLREEEGFPVHYISLHNEGEDWQRWPADGKSGNIGDGHDYNMFWPPEQVVEFINLMTPMLRKAGMKDVWVTNGEPSNWYRFGTWGYAEALYEDQEALNNMDIITSHGFYGGNYGRWFGEHKSAGIDLVREKKPDMHAWVTSTSWSRMDSRNIKEIHGNIYTAKVNALIPWAGIQRPPLWVGGDPNPGSAITVHEDGSYEVRKGYYFYKQVTRAGQPGMAVARANAMNSNIAVLAFASDNTPNADAFIIVNIEDITNPVEISVKGSQYPAFEAFRTTEEGDERYHPAGIYTISDGKLYYDAPPGSVTTFFGKKD